MESIVKIYDYNFLKLTLFSNQMTDINLGEDEKENFEYIMNVIY